MPGITFLKEHNYIPLFSLEKIDVFLIGFLSTLLSTGFESMLEHPVPSFISCCTKGTPCFPAEQRLRGANRRRPALPLFLAPEDQLYLT